MDDPKFIMWKPVRRSDIAWNFEKFLITPSGNPFQRFVPQSEFYITENGKGVQDRSILLSIYSGLCIPIMRPPFPQSKHIQICTVTLPPPNLSRSFSFFHRVHTEWQWLISGVHSIRWKNKPWLVGVVGGGGCTPTPFHSIYHHVQSCSVISS